MSVSSRETSGQTGIDSVPLIKVGLVDNPLEALKAVLQQTAGSTGLSILLAPGKRLHSVTKEELRTMTDRAVRDVTGGELVEPDTVYLASHDHHVSVDRGRFVVISRQLKSLAAAIESIPIGMLIADSERHILAINDELKRMSGYTEYDLAAKPIDVLIPEPQHGELQASWASYMTKREPVRMADSTQLAALRKDGREFPVEMSIHQLTSDDDGFVLAAITDVSDRQAVFEALRESERRFEHAVRGTTDGFWVWEVGTQEVFYSERFVTPLENSVTRSTSSSGGSIHRIRTGSGSVCSSISIQGRITTSNTVCAVVMDRIAGFMPGASLTATNRDALSGWPAPSATSTIASRRSIGCNRCSIIHRQQSSSRISKVVISN